MIIEDRRSRIIGDFLEANALLVEKRTKSKLPKFISRVFYKKEVNKLIAMIRKLRESDYVLDAKELIELFTFINNNFDNHSYKSIIAVKVINNGKITIALPSRKVKDMAQFLLDNGVDENRQVTVCERLSYPDEKIVSTSLKNIATSEFTYMCIMIISNEN